MFRFLLSGVCFNLQFPNVSICFPKVTARLSPNITCQYDCPISLEHNQTFSLIKRDGVCLLSASLSSPTSQPTRPAPPPWVAAAAPVAGPGTCRSRCEWRPTTAANPSEACGRSNIPAWGGWRGLLLICSSKKMLWKKSTSKKVPI